MPRYEFACQDCEARYEENRPLFAANNPSTCPNCDGTATKRLIGSSTMVAASRGQKSAWSPNQLSSVNVKRHGLGCICCIY